MKDIAILLNDLDNLELDSKLRIDELFCEFISYHIIF